MGRPKPPHAVPRGPGESEGRSRLYAFIAFLALSFLLYGNTLFNQFVHDDKPLVAENRLVQDPLDPVHIFTSGYWTTRSQSVPELYRPVTIFSLALNRSITGASPFGYHLVNILLNGWVCWLVLRWACRMGAASAVAWATALLFAVHPVHVEAVAPAVGRSELLAAGFGLCALLLHRRARAGGSTSLSLFTLAALSYLAACLSKEGAIVVPALALLSDVMIPSTPTTADRSRQLLPYAGYAAVAGIFVAVRVAVLGGVAKSLIDPMDNPLVAMSRWEAWRSAMIAGGKNLLLLIWPLHLSADYSGREIPRSTTWADPWFLASGLVLTLLLLATAWTGRRRGLAALGVFFYFIAWLPLSNLFFFIGVPLAERLLYFPSVGLCLAAGSLFGWGRGRNRLAVDALLAILLLAGSTRTIARNRIWHDDGSFAVATAANAPSSAKAQFNLGVYEEEHGDLDGAASNYQHAVALAPRWADAQFNLAGTLARTHRLQEAIDAYRRALALSPEDPRILLNLGFALYQAGRHQEAVDLYLDFLRRHGDSAAVLNSLAANYLAIGQTTEALAAYDKAVALAPDEVAYRLNLAQALDTAGEVKRAEEEYRGVLRAQPDSATALRNLGMLLNREGRRAEATALLRQAAQRMPGGLDPDAAAVLGAQTP
jgi:tetratricopeptide (TPR) repeat protein